MSRKHYLAVIGDIVRSREIPRRPEFQRRFARLLQTANHRFSRDIVSKFVVTLGDECQGLLRLSANVYGILVFLENGLYPVRVAFGIGRGTLRTGLRKFAIGMDGPCFVRAREALEEGKKFGRRLTFRGFGLKEESLNIVALLLQDLADSWTERQRELVTLARGARTQKALAERLGVYPSAVSKALASAHWRDFRKGEEYLVRALAGKE